MGAPTARSRPPPAPQYSDSPNPLAPLLHAPVQPSLAQNLQLHRTSHASNPPSPLPPPASLHAPLACSSPVEESPKTVTSLPDRTQRVPLTYHSEGHDHDRECMAKVIDTASPDGVGRWGCGGHGRKWGCHSCRKD